MDNYAGKWGLVFAGGGGKGAYEIGVWKALNEYNRLPIAAVSGTSVGALNAVLYASGNYEMAEDIWSHITKDKILTKKSLLEIITSKAFWKFISIMTPMKYPLPTNIINLNPMTVGNSILNPNTTSAAAMATGGYLIAKNVISSALIPMIGFEQIIKEINKLPTPISEYLRLYLDTGVFSRSGLENIINEKKVLDYFTGETISCYATCYNADRKEAKAFCLNDHDKEQIKRIILASSAIPAVFDPVAIDGCKYCDGGLVDNIPIKPLYDLGLRKFLVVHLNQHPSFLKKIKYLDSEVIDIYPKKDLGNFFNGTLDFNSEKAKQRIKYGYDDMIAILKERFKDYKSDNKAKSYSTQSAKLKTTCKNEIYLQFNGKSYSQEELQNRLLDIWKYDLGNKKDFQKADLYIKTEESKAYYVINDSVEGSFDI